MPEDLRATRLQVHLAEVDITEHPEVAVKYCVMATPAIAINGRLEFSGVPREDALRARDAAPATRGWKATIAPCSPLQGFSGEPPMPVPLRTAAYLESR